MSGAVDARSVASAPCGGRAAGACHRRDVRPGTVQCHHDQGRGTCTQNARAPSGTYGVWATVRVTSAVDGIILGCRCFLHVEIGDLMKAGTNDRLYSDMCPPVRTAIPDGSRA